MMSEPKSGDEDDSSNASSSNDSDDIDDEIDEDAVDPIFGMLSESQNVMCPNMSATLVQLINSEYQTEGLLQLSRFFRDQSTLLLKQAAYLEELALDEKLDPNETRNFGDEVHRKRMEFSVKPTVDLIEEAHDRIDAIQRDLYPWKMAWKRRVGVGASSRKPGYLFYLNENFDALAEEFGTRKTSVLLQKALRKYKSMSKMEKQPYEDQVDRHNAQYVRPPRVPKTPKRKRPKEK